MFGKREPILVTRRGVPVAEIKPPPETHAGRWLGSMAGTIEIVGDIVSSPAEPEDAWERCARETAARHPYLDLEPDRSQPP